MGAKFNQVSPYWWQLWGLALFNGLLAILLLAWRQRQGRAPDMETVSEG